MKLISFSVSPVQRRLGVLHENGILDVDELVASVALPVERRERLQQAGIQAAGRGMMHWLQLGAPGRSEVASRIAQRLADPGPALLPLSGCRIHAPVARPGKIVAVGRNYADHAKETGVAPFEKPRIIFKVPSSVADPGAVIRKPGVVHKMDFEVELAVVMGEFAHNVSVHEALDCVAGYTVLNDLSAREFQFDISPPQTTFAKSVDGFCPMGPWLTTADEVPDPQDLEVRTWLNGALMQQGHTADMLFPVRELIAYNSQFMTLEPGDVLATGTPAGIGAFRDPPVWLKTGDRLRMEVTGVGVLENSIGS